MDRQEQASMAEFTSRVVRRSLELRRKERREGELYPLVKCNAVVVVVILLILLLFDCMHS